jgi:hypothetical protein
MLRYDPGWLIEYYAEETPVRADMAYSRVCGTGPWQVMRHADWFRLTRATSVEPRLDFDETVVRLQGCEPGRLMVQPCKYSDGVRSNYAMDGEGGLREVLRAEYGRRLPPLGDTRLSNGLGTAIVVWDGEGKPYLPRRAPRQSVYPSGFHCTASGDAIWHDEGELLESHICRELEEEVGLTRADLEWIRPVALCREFLRGGKPQMFFAAQTRLAGEELAERRRKAIGEQLARGRQEVLDEALAEVTTATLKLCTMECVANLALADPAY